MPREPPLPQRRPLLWPLQPVLPTPQLQLLQQRLGVWPVEHILRPQPQDRLPFLLPQPKLKEHRRPRHAERQEQLKVLELPLQQRLQSLPRVGQVDLREREPKKREKPHPPVDETPRSHLLLPEEPRLREPLRAP